MSFGTFLGGFGGGFAQGVHTGKTLSELIKEGKLQDLREQGMKEAEAQRAASVQSMVKESGTTGEPAPTSGPVSTDAPKVETTATVAPTPASNPYDPSDTRTDPKIAVSPTANPDVAAANTAAASQVSASPASVAAPSDPTKGVLYIAGKPGQNPKGLVDIGNIDLNARPVVKNPDGSISTERSFSIGVNGKEVLIPQVVGGKLVSQQEAIDHFKKTGENLGTFDSPDAANAYAEGLHNRQDSTYNQPPASPQQNVVSNGVTTPAAPSAAATPAAATPVQKPNGQFSVNGQSFDTREQAIAAAEKAAPSAHELFLKNTSAKMAAQYVLNGEPEKAKAWTDYADSVAGKRAIKDWAAAYTAPDFDTAADKFGKYYTDHINDGVDYTGHKMLTKEDGTQVAVVTLKDKATGKSTEMEITREKMLAMGAANNPQKLFEAEQAKQAAADKIKLEAKIKHDQRSADHTDRINLEGYKQDRIDEREAGKGSNKKTTDPTERRALIRSDEMKNNPKFARMSPEEQGKAIDKAMETVYGPNANKADGPTKPAPVIVDKPMAFNKDLPVKYRKSDGMAFHVVDGQYIPIAGGVPSAAPAPAPKPAPAPAPKAAPAQTAPMAASGLPSPPVIQTRPEYGD